MNSVLVVVELEGVRFKKYVLQNPNTNVVIDRRFWTISGALRAAKRSVRNYHKKGK